MAYLKSRVFTARDDIGSAYIFVCELCEVVGRTAKWVCERIPKGSSVKCFQDNWMEGWRERGGGRKEGRKGKGGRKGGRGGREGVREGGMEEDEKKRGIEPRRGERERGRSGGREVPVFGSVSFAAMSSFIHIFLSLT